MKPIIDCDVRFEVVFRNRENRLIGQCWASVVLCEAERIPSSSSCCWSARACVCRIAGRQAAGTSASSPGPIVLAAGSGLGRHRRSSGCARECNCSAVARVEQMIDQARLASSTQPTPTAFRLSSAINDLVDYAEKASPMRMLKVKELEIQLKVATAERQHAEAIIYSISDAVLVTDPFDELVLANESAARTFDFELASAGRSPVEQVLQRSEDDRADPRDAAEQQQDRPADRRAPASSTDGGRPHLQGHALLRGRSRATAPGRRGGGAARHDPRERSRGDEERLRLQRQPRAAHAAGQHQGVRRNADRRRSRRREDHARVLRRHPERGQPPGPADRQHPEHHPHRVGPGARSTSSRRA